ncbi:histone-like nucleoid-structuring protein Lsr2 (plasmid) [Dermatophilaceae bacterium Soc4.6]
MAHRTIVTITDDLDGSDDAQTVVFSFKDTVYTVDLSSRNQQKMLQALEPFITAATVVSRPSRTAARSTRAPARHRPR